jgi:HEXXH motif-containing protein
MNELDINNSVFTEALPVRGRASGLIGRFNTSLLNSLLYLLEVCEDSVSPETYHQATQNIKSLNPAKKVSGILSALHRDLYLSIESEDEEKVSFVINKLANDRFQREEIRFLSLEQLDPYYAELLRNICLQERREKVEYKTLTQDEFDTMERSIRKGLEALRNYCPDYYDETETLVSEILLLKGENLKQGSSIDMIGTIYKCYFFKWEKLIDTIEFLIHEQSHLILHILNLEDQLILNPLERHVAPLRNEMRPLMGIYHATYVIARVINVIERLAELKKIPNEEIEYCSEFLENYRSRYRMGYETIKAHAQLTPMGQEIMNSVNKLVEIPYAA